MGSYAAIPLVALFLYVLMLVTFVAAKKSQPIKCFIVQLIFMVMWSGGSFLMRVQFLGLVNVWFHLSLSGIWIACIFWDRLMAHIGEKRMTLPEHVLSVLVVLLVVVNCATDWFFAPPEVVTAVDGTTQFVYNNFGVGTYLMYALLLVFFVIIICRIVGCVRNRTLTRVQIVPLCLGSFLMILCNIIIVLPIFSGFPLDIAAGVVFAVCNFICLYYMHLFSLTLAFSRRTYATFTAIVIVLFATQLTGPAYSLLRSFGMSSHAGTVVVSLITVAVAVLVYLLVTRVSDGLFMREHNSRAEGLHKFHTRISESLDVDEVSELLCKQVKDNVRNVTDVRVCLRNGVGDFFISGSTDSLENGLPFLGGGSAVFTWMRKHDEILTMAEFNRSFESRIMWEEEKLQLIRMNVDVMMPLSEGGDVLGALIITLHDPKRGMSLADSEYLTSLNVVATASIKNAQLYQQVALDAMTDDLTGLLNRKHFLRKIDEAFEANPGQIMSLMIINIDDFKLYNQLYGVAVGDETLRRVASVLSSTVGEGNFIARYSGKEFAIFMPGSESAAAKRLADILRQQIYDLNRREDDESPLKILTCSIGICTVPFDAHTAKQLLENADMAVFQVKQHGKNGVMVFATGTSQNDEEPAEIDRKELYSNYANTIFALAAAIDAKDHYTFTHSNNVAYYASSLAKAVGLNADTVELIHEAGLLHDIGKIGIPENILNKPGRLDQDEYEIMKRHPEHAVAIIRHLPSLDYVIPAVVGHHERWDGKGYPRGLAGEDIPLTARILCVGDVFDAITTKRCYQDPRGLDNALRIIEDGAGTQFDPELAKLFVAKVREGVIELQ